MPAHQPSLVRDVVEKVGGALGAVSRVPGSFISGLAVGGYQGVRQGIDPNFEITPKSCATGLVACNAAQGLMIGAAGAFAVMGPLGAAASVAKDSVGAGVRTYMFVKGGSAGAMGAGMADSIDSSVADGEGALQGLSRGAWAGAKSAARGAARTGYLEGHAAASGMAEGCQEVARHYGESKSTKGLGLFRRLGAVVAGTLSAAMAAPVAAAFAAPTPQLQEPGRLKRLGLSALSGAALGAAAGSLGGLVGVAVGAGLGAVAGLLGPASKEGFTTKVGASVEKARADDTDLGDDIANRRRDLVQRTITGLASGARQGWNSGVARFSIS